MSYSGQQRTPRQLIERIRTHSFLLDLDTESEMVKEGALNLQKQLNNALQLLSQDLYSKKSHFILELVQNADDNHYEPGITPHLTFQMAPNCLVVVNNELGFNEANIKAICSVGASSKSKEKTGYIGEKGIGFKSVFTVSNAPEIHSNKFHFRFDRTDERNLLGYVVPHWCEAPEGTPSDCTTIILPAGNDYQFGPDTLVDLDARLLLFLNKLRQLTLAHGGKRVTYRRHDHANISHLTAEHISEVGQLTTDETRYIRTEITFPMKDSYADVKRPNVERATVVLAFPVGDDGAAKPDPLSNVFAFLPVRQMGFKFAIQSDFILSSSREEILTDRSWNKLLRAGVASVFAKAVELFKGTDALAFSYLKYVPLEGEVADPFFRVVRKSIIDVLSKTACLPSTSLQWKQPGELRIAEKSFRTLFPSKFAQELFGFDYVDHRMQGGNELLRSLGAKDVLPDDTLSIFVKHGAWLQRQPLEWRAKFYAYIANNQAQLFGAGLLNCPCLPISDGTLMVPSSGNVFFPLSRGKRYGFEDELVFVNNDVYEEAQKYSDRVPDLFNALKVRSDEPYDLVNSHILSKHSGESWMGCDSKALIGHLRYVKDKLEEYLKAATSHGRNEGLAFQALRDGIWVGTKLNMDGNWVFARVGQLYLSKEYKSRFCIETLLADGLKKDSLVSADYLSTKRKDQEAEAESWRDFFVRLGILQAPAIEAEGLDWKCSDEMRLLLESTQSNVRRSTLECIDRHWMNYSGRLMYNQPHGRHSSTQRVTKFAVSLRATQAPTNKKMAVALSECYYPTTELKGLLGDGPPYVDAVLTEAMREACRITHKLDAKALVKRLNQLKLEGGDTAKQLQGIYRALDERLWEADEAFIKSVFHADGLIRTKGTHKAWSSPSEVSWKSNSPFMDSLYPPIQGQYRDFSRFFIDRLGIPRDLPTTKWVEALTSLVSVISPEERRSEALAIYRKANGDLRPKSGRDEALQPSWLETFESEAVYLNHRGELVVNDGSLFANDAPELAALFDDEEGLSFLSIAPADVPRMTRFLDATVVHRLRESVDIEVIDAESGVVDADLTGRVLRAVPFFARVLYAKRHDTFEHALDAGLFARMREFVVAEVPQVNLSVSLGKYSRVTTADIALSGARALYRSNAKSVKDRLAAELCKFLGAPTDLADTFTRILMEDDPESVEDFLAVRNIGFIPPDLLKALDNSGDPLVQDAEAEVNESHSVDASVQDKSHESGVLIVEVESTGAGGNPEDGGIAPAPSVSQITIDAEVPNAVSVESSTVLDTFGSLAIQPVSRVHMPGGIATRDSKGLPTRALNPPRLGEDSPRGEMGGGGTPLLTSPSQAPLDDFPADASRVTPNWTPLGGPSQGRKKSGGQSHPPRTKAGRLMSYAAGPGDSDRLHPDDDPTKAAQREATGRAAVEYFLTTQAARWKSLTEMPHNNPGFDVHAITHDDHDEYIEVKGQGGAWTEDGVALTPMEFVTAQKKGDRYWLCVVEYAQEEQRRQLHLLRNPYGLTQQFRFDSGWKSAAEIVGTTSLRPEKDIHIEMPGVGQGRILSVREKGRFFNLHVILKDGRQVNKLFNPAKMTLSKEPTWQG
jgi:hypothetical protein